ncbi:hypothetical protein P7K49_024691 [Saguinus oedipus]|uniref:Uncharacterized protein n=1 Tax=Saguinus oedipus TaxID=9490 RepID=A0ABQ9UR52_SAGOE|nr:hypothetical protein P7K49_024691 [Saguinus oedipus]
MAVTTAWLPTVLAQVQDIVHEEGQLEGIGTLFYFADGRVTTVAFRKEVLVTDQGPRRGPPLCSPAELMGHLCASQRSCLSLIVTREPYGQDSLSSPGNGGLRMSNTVAWDGIQRCCLRVNCDPKGRLDCRECRSGAEAGLTGKRASHFICGSVQDVTVRNQ